jgi:hypothetical protein
MNSKEANAAEINRQPAAFDSLRPKIRTMQLERPVCIQRERVASHGVSFPFYFLQQC